MFLPAFARRLIGANERHVFRLAEHLPWYRPAYTSEASPIIVGGCGRSGTTLMRVILDTHSQVCCGPESNLLCCWRPRRFFAKRLVQNFGLAPADVLELMRRTHSHAEFVDRLFRQLCQQNHADIWAEKTPRNVHAMDYVFRHFPHARFIHMIRDGRDTVCSLRRHPRFRVVNGRSVPTNVNNPIQGCLRRWVVDVRQGLRWSQDPRYFEVRYEDLVTDPGPTLQNLFQFLRLPWEAQVMNFHHVKSDMRDVTRFPQNPEAARPMYKSAVGRWRTDLPPDDLAYVQSHAGGLLQELGYTDD